MEVKTQIVAGTCVRLGHVLGTFCVSWSKTIDLPLLDRVSENHSALSSGAVHNLPERDDLSIENRVGRADGNNSPVDR